MFKRILEYCISIYFKYKEVYYKNYLEYKQI